MNRFPTHFFIKVKRPDDYDDVDVTNATEDFIATAHRNTGAWEFESFDAGTPEAIAAVGGPTAAHEADSWLVQRQDGLWEQITHGQYKRMLVQGATVRAVRILPAPVDAGHE